MFAILRRVIGLSLVSAAWALSLVACGTKPTYSPSSVATPTADAKAAPEAGKVDINFTLPDRAALADAKDEVNGYYYHLTGSGANCPAGNEYEEVGAYEDKKLILFRVSAACDYAVVMKIGTLDGSALALADEAPINYESDIKPIVATNCLSCHADYGTYQGVMNASADIIRTVEEGSMPQAAPLPDADIAKLLAWSGGGYLEQDPTPAATTKEAKIEKVFYRNNNNDKLMAHELASRDSFQLRRSLWLQSDGEAAGVTLRELLTYGN